MSINQKIQLKLFFTAPVYEPLGSLFGQKTWDRNHKGGASVLCAYSCGFSEPPSDWMLCHTQCIWMDVHLKIENLSHIIAYTTYINLILHK